MRGSITAAVENWRDGGADAAVDIDERFQAWMLRMVRRRRPPELRHRIDSHGVVSAALYRFLTGVQTDKFPMLNDRSDIRKILTTIVCRQLSTEARDAQRMKRGVNRESRSADECCSRDMSPYDQVRYQEDLLHQIPKIALSVHECGKRIVELSMEGLKTDEICKELSREFEISLSPRSVQRIIALICQRITRFGEN